MRSKEDIENLVQRLYSQLGNDPSDITQIKPIDGDWYKETGITRCHIKSLEKITLQHQFIDEI